MTLALFFLAAVATVPVTGGRLSALADVRIRGRSLLVAGFGIQILLVTVFPGGNEKLHELMHLGTYGLAGWAVILNRHLPYAGLVALGGALNFAAIAANGGVMPASESALRAAGLATKTGGFANSDVVPDARLNWLGDVFATPSGIPGANVFSFGDVVMGLGGLLLLHALTGSRIQRLLARGRARFSSPDPKAGRRDPASAPSAHWPLVARPASPCTHASRTLPV